jgi:hypothetical protein
MAKHYSPLLIASLAAYAESAAGPYAGLVKSAHAP